MSNKKNRNRHHQNHSPYNHNAPITEAPVVMAASVEPVVEAVAVEASPTAPVAKRSFRDRCNAARTEFAARVKASWERVMAAASLAWGYTKVAFVVAFILGLIVAMVSNGLHAADAQRKAEAYRQSARIIANAAQVEIGGLQAKLKDALAPKPTIGQRLYGACQTVHAYTVAPVVSFDRGTAARLGLTSNAGIGE
jgi:hypothetical protein